MERVEERWGFCAWRERKCGRGMQAQKGEEGKEKHDVGVGKARSLSRDAGRVSSRPRFVP